MKRSDSRLLAFACGLIGLAAWADIPQTLPTPFPEARYQQMSAKSPFAVATAGANANAAPTPGFASQLYVEGVGKIGTEDYVAIKSRDSQDPSKPTSYFLVVGGTTADGMKVDAIHWSDERAKSTVDVSKNGEKATLSFDEAQMEPKPGVPQLAANQSGVRLPTLPGARPAGFPAVAPQQPNIPANLRNRIFPGQQSGNGAPLPNGAMPGTDMHRRRVIPSGP